MSKLTDIEKEISGCVSIDKTNWTRIYRLMDEVKREKLYLERTDTPSFTSWVNALSEELGVHVSLLWSRNNAGRVYEEYKQRAKEKNRPVPNLEDISVSPDSISLCAKVAGKNATEMDRLIDHVLEGKLTREDLRAAARAKRGASVASGGNGGMATSRHNRIEAKDRVEMGEKVSAADIVMALRKSNWLVVKREEPYFNHVYHCFPEFRVTTGTSHYARKIDVLVAETITEAESDHVTLRGIEIKVNLNDLKSDHKMAEYTDYVDYFYIAIPANDAEMLDTAKSIIRPSWGIMTVTKSGAIHLEKEAAQLDAVFREKAMATALIKMLSEHR